MYLEDNNFGLNYKDIKCCLTNTDPGYNPAYVVDHCWFAPINNYTYQSSSSFDKYFYKIPITDSYTYTIVYYDGNNPSGALYVHTDYNDLAKTNKITQVKRNSKTSLTTNSSYNKYFYLLFSDYYSYSSDIYICLEDNKFGLHYNKIRYCPSKIDPISNPDDAIMYCIFIYISNYTYQSSYNVNKYYYKIPTTDSYNYSIIYYDGDKPSGSLYVTADYNELFKAVKMTQVSLDTQTPLTTNSSYDKYFYLKNRDYLFYYNGFIYICFEDNNFGLSYNNIKYCQTYYNPSTNPNDAAYDCSFTSITYDAHQNDKYYYKIPTSNTYTYSIVSYDGRNPSGSLYVTTDYNEFVKTVKMTKVSSTSKTSLPIISSYDKYFYVINSDYYSHSNYLYFYLEDNNFGLNSNNIAYCITSMDPYSYPDEAVKGCSFNTIYYYDPIYNSNSRIYHYKILIPGTYSYTIVHYEGYSSYGNLYVYCDYKSNSTENNESDGNSDNSGNNVNNVNNEGLSAGAIVGIIFGIIVLLVICAIIFYYRWRICKRNNIDSISVTQPNYIAPIGSAYPSNQNSLLHSDNSDIQLKMVP